jgi:hypothetical protein
LDPKVIEPPPAACEAAAEDPGADVPAAEEPAAPLVLLAPLLLLLLELPHAASAAAPAVPASPVSTVRLLTGPVSGLEPESDMTPPHRMVPLASWPRG